MKQIWKKICSLAAAAVITVSGFPTMTFAGAEDVYPDGLYQINARFTRSDSPDKLSMADAALEKDEKGEKKPVHIRIQDGQAYVQLRFININYMGQTGYLGSFDYYPDMTDKNTIPVHEDVPTAAIVDEYYNVFDSFNDPVSGSDGYVRGKLYPQQVTIPVQQKDDEVWTRVYVPVMEQIAEGSGTQIIRLQLDWSADSFIQIRDENIDIGSLEQKIQQALQMQKGEASDESWKEFSDAVSEAQKVLEDLLATQEKINEQVQILDHVMAKINDENKVKADKKELSELIALAEEKVLKTDIYTKDSLENLKNEIQNARSVLQDENIGQTQVNQAGRSLKNSLDQLKTLVNKEDLRKMINDAESTLKQGIIYTKESSDLLNAAIESARNVLEDESAGQDQVDAQTQAVAAALKGLDRPKENVPVPFPDKTQDSEDIMPETVEGSEPLDIKNLKDGTYVVRGKMIKTNKTDASMSDKAINHNIRLTVKDGEYFISLSFKGMTISGKTGYLGGIRYFKSGYRLGEYGKPEGDLGNVTINAYQTDADGKNSSDQYGTDYMKDVTFPLIPEALNDGYVPLQVFVPVMEDIAAGGGTQNVFLYLDYSTLKAVAADDETAFEDNDPSEENEQSGVSDLSSTQAGPTVKSGPAVKGGPTAKTGAGVPKTGDGSTPGFYMFLAGISAVAMFTAGRKRKVERK